MDAIAVLIATFVGGWWGFASIMRQRGWSWVVGIGGGFIVACLASSVTGFAYQKLSPVWFGVIVIGIAALWIAEKNKKHSLSAVMNSNAKTMTTPEDVFDAAFARVTSETTLSGPAKLLIKPLVQAGYDGGDVRVAVKKILAAVPENTWTWSVYDEQAPSDGQTEMLVNRVLRIAHSLGQRQRILQSAEALPWLMLDVSTPARARPECLAADGRAWRWNDPYWNKNFPPCDRLDCICGVIPMTQDQVARNGLSALPPGEQGGEKATTPTVQRQPASSRQPSADPWLRHCEEIEEAWERGDFNQARAWLQQIAYGMVDKSVSPEVKAQFTKLMTEFAAVDPLYIKIMERLRPMIATTPGLVQSTIYKGEPDDIKEHMRYVLYFAEQLGEIIRVKKGNSYRLYLPNQQAE